MTNLSMERSKLFTFESVKLNELQKGLGLILTQTSNSIFGSLRAVWWHLCLWTGNESLMRIKTLFIGINLHKKSLRSILHCTSFELSLKKWQKLRRGRLMRLWLIDKWRRLCKWHKNYNKSEKKGKKNNGDEWCLISQGK